MNTVHLGGQNNVGVMILLIDMSKIIFILFAGMVLTLSCARINSNSYYKKIEKLVQTGGEGAIYSQEEIFPGHWEEIFVIPGIACEEHITSITGINYKKKKCVQDHESLILFVLEGRIIKQKLISRYRPTVDFNFGNIKRSEKQGFAIQTLDEVYMISSVDRFELEN